MFVGQLTFVGQVLFVGLLMFVVAAWKAHAFCGKLTRKRRRMAEAKKVMVVMAAEAEKEARKLNGEGIADQRKAIVEGLKESVCQFVRSASPLVALKLPAGGSAPRRSLPP